LSRPKCPDVWRPPIAVAVPFTSPPFRHSGKRPRKRPSFFVENGLDRCRRMFARRRPRSDQSVLMHSSAGARGGLYSVCQVAVILLWRCHRRLGGFWFTRRLRPYFQISHNIPKTRPHCPANAAVKTALHARLADHLRHFASGGHQPLDKFARNGNLGRPKPVVFLCTCPDCKAPRGMGGRGRSRAPDATRLREAYCCGFRRLAGCRRCMKGPGPRAPVPVGRSGLQAAPSRARGSVLRL